MNLKLNDNSDEVLIEQCLCGNSQAQELLYRKYAPKMFSLCVRYMGNQDDAKDVLQDGFITVFRKIGDYRRDGSFEGWLRRVFVTSALIRLRKDRQAPEQEDIDSVREPICDNRILDELSYRELLGLVASLPDKYRAVFNMYVIEGYSHKEIGQALGINEVTSRSCLNRARQWLQTEMKKLGRL